MPKQKTYEFEVTGSGAFPTDMLRYDSCYPAREIVLCVDRHDPNYKKSRTIRIRSHSFPTVQRWVSFGWYVTNIEER